MPKPSTNLALPTLCIPLSTAVPAADDGRGVRERHVHAAPSVIADGHVGDVAVGDVPAAPWHKRSARRARGRPHSQGYANGGSTASATSADTTTAAATMLHAGLAEGDARGRGDAHGQEHADTRDEA